MKKLIVWMLALMLLLSLTACGEKAPADNSGETQPGQSNTSNDAPAGQTLTVESLKAASETPAEEFEWTDEEGGVIITGYNGNGGVVVIPKKIDNMDVVAIGDSAFVNNKTITAVRLSDTVQEVERQAFLNCSGMKIFVSGTSVKYLGPDAFNNCVGLKTVELNEGLETIDYVCFVGMGNAEIVVPTTVTAMDSAFMGESAEAPIIIVGEPGSIAEEYVAINGESCHLVFKAK